MHHDVCHKKTGVRSQWTCLPRPVLVYRAHPKKTLDEPRRESARRLRLSREPDNAAMRESHCATMSRATRRVGCTPQLLPHETDTLQWSKPLPVSNYQRQQSVPLSVPEPAKWGQLKCSTFQNPYFSAAKTANRPKSTPSNSPYHLQGRSRPRQTHGEASCRTLLRTHLLVQRERGLLCMDSERHWLLTPSQYQNLLHPSQPWQGRHGQEQIRTLLRAHLSCTPTGQRQDAMVRLHVAVSTERACAVTNGKDSWSAGMPSKGCTFT